MMTDMTNVERFEPYTDEGNREGYGQMEMCEGGDWVRATDYDALTAKLAEVTYDCDNLQIALASARKQLKRYIEEAEAHIAHLENHIEGVAKDTHKIMVAHEAALPAAYRLGLEAAAKRVEARAAGNPFSAGQYANSAFVIRRLPTLTAAELMARIQTGETDNGMA